MNKSRVHWLDLCRAMAISLVLLSHGRSFLIPVAPWAQSLKFGGFLGVELFFVLSGFLIGSIMIKQIDTSSSSFGWIRNFWVRRWLRTVPNYLLFIGINLLLVYSIRPDAVPNLALYLTFTQNFAWQHPPFFAEAWSLAVEEIFYLTTPLVIGAFLLITKRTGMAVMGAVLTIFVVSVAARAYVVLFLDPTFDDGVRKISLLRLDALMTGVLVAWVYRYRRDAKSLLRKISIVLLVPFFYAIYLAAKPDVDLNGSAFLRIFLFNIASFGCAGLIMFGMDFKMPPSVDFVMSKLARWSYSAYLTNLPVLFAVRYFLPLQQSVAACILLWALYIFFTFFTGYLIYELYERKFLALRDRIS